MTLIHELLPVAARRLVTLIDSAPVIEAARLLSKTETALVIVCDVAGLMSGVVTKTDIVQQISHCTGCSCTENISDIMTREVISCDPDDQLMDVWNTMSSKGLKQIPVRNAEGRPLGLLYANDAVEILLKEAEHQELLLRDYVMGTGYR